MICWYYHKKNSKSEPPGIKLMIVGAVTFEKHKKNQCFHNSANKIHNTPRLVFHVKFKQCNAIFS